MINSLFLPCLPATFAYASLLQPHELSLSVIRRAQAGELADGVRVMDEGWGWSRRGKVETESTFCGVAVMTSPDSRLFRSGRADGDDASFFISNLADPTFSGPPEARKELGKVPAYAFLGPSHDIMDVVLPMFRKNAKQHIALNIGHGVRDLASIGIRSGPFLKASLFSALCYLHVSEGGSGVLKGAELSISHNFVSDFRALGSLVLLICTRDPVGWVH